MFQFSFMAGILTGATIEYFTKTNKTNKTSDYNKIKTRIIADLICEEYKLKSELDELKEPKSAFLIYVGEIQKIYPTETMDILQQRWIKLNKEEKQIYMEQEEKANETYVKEYDRLSKMIDDYKLKQSIYKT